MIEDLIESIDNDLFIENIIKLLEYESEIDYKKNNGEKLTSEERFFDTYILKPSVMVSVLSRRIKNEKNNFRC